MSSSYYTKIKTRREILQELKNGIQVNLNLANDIIKGNSEINVEVFFSSIKGVTLCDIKESIINTIGITGTSNIENIDELFIEKGNMHFFDARGILETIHINNKLKKEFEQTLDNYQKEINTFEIISDESIKHYNKFVDNLNNIILNEHILFSHKLELIKSEYNLLIDYLKKNVSKKKIEDKIIVNILKKLYKIDANDIDVTDTDQVMSILEKRYTEQAIKNVLFELGYSEYAMLNFNALDGIAYSNDNLLNNLFIANDEDKLVIENIYEDRIYQTSSNYELENNFTLSCQQNELLIKKLMEYGIELQVLYKEEPEISNVSIINNSTRNKIKTLHQKGRKMSEKN